MLKFQRGFWKQQSLLDLIQQILGPSSADCSLVTQRHSPQSQGPPRRSLLRLAQLSILLMVNLDRMSLILAYTFRITYLVTIHWGYCSSNVHVRARSVEILHQTYRCSFGEGGHWKETCRRGEGI